MSEIVHTYSGNPFDRGESLRRSEDTITELATSPDTRFLPFHKLKVASDGESLTWLDANAIQELSTGDLIFLGTQNDVAYFAVDLPEPPAELSFTDCRTIAASVSTEETGVIAQARAQFEWHRRNPFCAECGAPSRAERGGQIRRCTACEKHIFPRTDAVAIMLIVDQPGGDRCLLGRPNGRFANTNFYTALAGFLDQAESLEEAVRREVWEEAGLRVGPVHYHSSQPWPFPSQLMIGCHGIASTTDINFDPIEMADVRWFTREEARAGLFGDETTRIRVPGKMAIAHHLIRSWVDGEIDL